MILIKKKFDYQKIKVVFKLKVVLSPHVKQNNISKTNKVAFNLKVALFTEIRQNNCSRVKKK